MFGDLFLEVANSVHRPLPGLLGGYIIAYYGIFMVYYSIL